MLNMAKYLLLMSLIFFLGCSQVTVKQEDENRYDLVSRISNSVTLDSSDLRDAAVEVCPEGYNILSQSYYSPREISYSEYSCISGACKSQVEWHIVCTNDGIATFSLFGDF